MLRYDVISVLSSSPRVRTMSGHHLPWPGVCLNYLLLAPSHDLKY